MPSLPVLPGCSSNRDSVASEAVRAALARELVNTVAGEVRFGFHDRMLYATDASLYQVEPIGVVIPADVEDAARAVRFCADRGVAILPRGGGTSLAGQCTNHAVVIDFSPNCRALVEVDGAARRARVEPGLTVDDLNDQIAGMGLFFAPDPATSRHANIGGCIGNNAAGARSILYGRTSENLISVDVVLADGARLRLGPGAAREAGPAAELTRRVCEVVWRNRVEIRARFPRTIRRNAGYGLDMILDQLEGVPGVFESMRGVPRGTTSAVARAGLVEVSETRLAVPLPEMWREVNLAPLLCGSEGTLAVTLGAELKLMPRPVARGLAVAAFATLDEAIEAVLPILGTGPSAVELLDDMVIDLARANAEYRRYVELMPAPPGGELKAVLYIEYSAMESAGELAAKFGELRRALPGVPDSAVQLHTDAGAMLSAWKLRKAGEPLLHGIPGDRKPITFIEDNAVPVENLARFVRELRGIVSRYGTRAAYWAHASVGVLHVRPLLDLHDEEDRGRMRAMAVEVADLARSLGGVMSGEHGDGRVRGPLLERFYGPALMGAFREVKAIFDPSNLLNPGNIVDLDGMNPRPLESMTEKLRVDGGERGSGARDSGVVEGVETYFEYGEQHGFDHAVEMCNGAGVCRKKQGGTMCPSYMATLDERHSTRGRGNALRLAITGQVERFGGHRLESGATGTAHRLEAGATGTAGATGPVWDDPGTIGTLHLCLSCKACKTECPSNVDISKLKAEYTAQRYRGKGAPIAARIMGEIRWLNRLGAMMPGVSNAVARIGLVRGVINTVLGLDPRRSLPPFDVSLKRRWGRGSAAGSDATRGGSDEGAARRAAVPKAPRVVLFGDCFTMYNEPGIGVATRAVLERLGYRVELADAGCCGRAKISMGLLPEAIEEADATLGRLRPVIEDEGVVAVLVAEPSCLSAFKDDWLSLKLRMPIAVRRKLAGKAFLPEDFVERMWERHPRKVEFVKSTGGQAASGTEKAILHGHCHQKALWGAESSAKLLRRVFGSGLTVLDSGCCGMAGSFGYTKDRYDLSMKIGEQVVLPAARKAGEEGAVVIAPGTSCRHQIHDGAGVQARHPMEVVAEWMSAIG
ncbi:MAG: FAD-binding protein [Phycisphaerales bacterium]|nr:FAD-binding protein [Phycisphaerales bacterium]